MQHLSGEALARLVDGAAGPGESGHLEVCAGCRAELAGAREQKRALGGLGALRPREEAWPALERRLRAEGLLRPRERGGRRMPSAGLLRIAAAIALFLAGAGTGAALRGDGATGGEFASGAPDATAELRAAEAAYLVALTRYAEISGAGEVVDPVNRLAALEGIVLTTRAALREAPADPVINGYHLTALSQREAMLRELDAGVEGGWY